MAYRVRSVFRSFTPNVTPEVVDVKCWRVTVIVAPGSVSWTINGAPISGVMGKGQAVSAVQVGGAMAGPDPVPFIDTWTISNAGAGAGVKDVLFMIFEYMDPR